MKPEINLKELVKNHLPPWNVETQHRLNHEGCPAGIDTRRRLYIKSVEPIGSWIGHCFNCGGSGVWFSNEPRSLTEVLKSKTTHLSLTPSITQKKYSVDVYKEVADIRNKVWLYRYHLFEEDWNKLGIREVGGDIVIPINDVSMQIRTLEGNPKYINYIGTEDNRGFFERTDVDEINNETVYTEDILSAYRLHRDCGVDVVACIGTNITPRIVEWSPQGTNYIWFDGDTAGRQASTKAAKVLKNAVIIVEDKSPKEYTPEELVEVTKRWVK